MTKQMLRFFSILFALFLYTGHLFAELWPGQPGKTWAAAFLLFVWIMGWQFLYRACDDFFEFKWFRGLAWSGSLLMGLWGTLVLLSIPIDLIQTLVGAASDLSAGESERLTQGIHWVIFAVAFGISVFGLFEVLRGPNIKEMNLAIEGLSEGLKGLRLVQISDLHVGPTIRRRYADRVVDSVNRLRPDLILLTGDLADGRAGTLAPHLEPLRRLKARYGAYYVTGNHEYYWGAGDLVKAMRDFGHTALLNDNRLLEINGCRLIVAGVTDPTAAQFHSPAHPPDVLQAFQSPNLQKALQTSKSADFKILLSHRPGICDEAEARGVNLQLSGHTHGGQFFPFSLLIPFAHKYYRGLNRHGKLWLYVNPGTGYWGPGNRLGVPAEITSLVLVAQQQ